MRISGEDFRARGAAYTLELRDVGGSIPVDVRLKTLIKRALRSHGLRATKVEQVDLGQRQAVGTGGHSRAARGDTPLNR